VKLSELEKGSRAVRRVRFPLANMRAPFLPDLPELAAQRKVDRERFDAQRSEAAEGEAAPSVAPDSEVWVGLRVLTGAENSEVLQNAQTYAKARGVDPWNEDHAICTLAKMVFTLLLACVDPDDKSDDPPPFFDDADQILNSHHLGRDGIVWLYEAQELWQEQTSPLCPLEIEPEAYFALMLQIAKEDNPDPFVRMRAGLRWTFARSMAVQLLHLLTLKSGSGLQAGSNTTSAPKKNRSRVNSRRH